MVHLRTLGGLELEGSDFHRPKPLLLLAYLALEGAKDRRHLSELFWPRAAEPLTSVRVALSQLRQAAPEAVEVDERRVKATVRVDALNLLGLLDGGKPTELSDIYRGAFLADVYFPDWSAELEEWVYGTREFLAERVRERLLRDAEVEAAGGNFDAAAKRAERAHRLPGAPEPEPEVLERTYRLLVAGDSLRAKELQNVAKGYGIALTSNRAEARGRLSPPARGEVVGEVPRNLPVRSTTFVGRDPELIELARLIGEPQTRLITLSGAGGMGKSRLALQAAYGELKGDIFPDGVYFVPLDSLSDPDRIPATIAGILDLKLHGHDAPLAQLIRGIGDRRLLLILDNYEQLIEGAAIASKLLKSCPGLKLLVSSRERLNLEEEQVFSVEGLSLPESVDAAVHEAGYQDAVQLFVQRAKRVQLNFRLNEESLPHVVKICRLLDGSPLGIELSAAWVRLMPVAEIINEVENSLDFLTSSTRNIADRHRSMRATFEHSWKLLTQTERSVLRKLSVFVGGFTREAASQVAGASIPLLASLVDKSLLRVLPNGRYDRHPLLYQYAQEKLSEHSKEYEEAVREHALYFLAFVEEAEPELEGSEQAKWLEHLEAEHDNLRVVLQRTVDRQDGAVAARLGGAVWRFWHTRGYLSEGRRWLERALATLELETGSQPGVRTANVEVQAKALKGSGVLAWAQGDHAQAEALFDEGLALFQELGDQEGVADMHNNLGVIALHRGAYEKAAELLKASLALRREQGDTWGVAACLNNLGATAGKQGDSVEAQMYYEESLGLFRELGNKAGVAFSLSNLGDVAESRGDVEQAYGLFGESLALRRALGDKVGVAASLAKLGTVARRRGDVIQAQSLHGESLKLLRELGDRERITDILGECATIALTQKQPERATRLWGSAEALREIIGAPLPPGQRPEYQDAVAHVRAELSEAAFETAWAEGRAMTFDEAVEYALATAEHPASRIPKTRK